MLLDSNSKPPLAGSGRLLAKLMLAFLLSVAVWLMWEWTKPIYDPPPEPQNLVPGP